MRLVYPNLFWCIDYIAGQLGLLCAETWQNLTERIVYILGRFVFFNTSMLVRKTWDALHTKNTFATFPLFIASADKIQKYKIEWFSETEKLLLLTLWQRPQEHFNRHPLLCHLYTPTFDVIPYTLKTLERYFPGLIEHIRVCRPSSGFSFVIRFATKSVLQNIHTLVLVIHAPTHIE